MCRFGVVRREKKDKMKGVERMAFGYAEFGGMMVHENHFHDPPRTNCMIHQKGAPLKAPPEKRNQVL